MERRDFLKVAGGTLLAGTSCACAFPVLTTSKGVPPRKSSPLTGKKMGMVIDVGKCQEGCTACLDACREENNVADHEDRKLDELDVHWIRKITLEQQLGDTVVKKPVILVCNHCDNPPCAQVCPVQATFKREDGIVIVDHHRCIGCRYCMIACPYNARYFNFREDHIKDDFKEPLDWPNPDRPKRSHGVAESCTLCAHLLDKGETPACVRACEEAGHGALAVGDMNDTTPSKDIEPDTVYELLRDNPVKRIREDLGTEPKVHYIGL